MQLTIIPSVCPIQITTESNDIDDADINDNDFKSVNNSQNSSRKKYIKRDTNITINNKFNNKEENSISYSENGIVYIGNSKIISGAFDDESKLLNTINERDISIDAQSNNTTHQP